jgi:hypothetical protein
MLERLPTEQAKKKPDELVCNGCLADAVVHRPIEGELMAAALRRYFKVRGSEKEELDDH